jgi:hypothetical protein
VTQGRPLVFVSGQRFGSLTVVSIQPGSKGAPRRVNCRCDCGLPYSVQATKLFHGFVVRCFDCLPKRRTAEQKAFRRRFDNYRNSSRTKNHNFDFSREEFKVFYEAACTYCGFVPAKGIDRKNNSLGYIKENCVPCCNICNYAKRDMTTEKFFAWLRRLVEHQKGFDL